MAVLKRTKALNNKRKTRKEDRETSEKMRVALEVAFSDFNEIFPNSEACRAKLHNWLNWEIIGKKEKRLKFVCSGKLKETNEKCTSKIAYRYFKDKEKIREVFRCPECEKEYSYTTETIFKSTKTDLWIWFLSIYLMSKLEGKRPISFLTMKYTNYLLDLGYESDDDPDKLQKKVRQRVRRVTSKIYKELFERKKAKQLKRRDNYLELLGLKQEFRFDSFLSWNKANEHQKKKWKIGLRDSKPKRCKDAKKDTENQGLTSTHYYQNFVRREDASFGDWVLCVSLIAESKITIKWLHVDGVGLLKKKTQGCEWQAYQLDKRDFYKRPFRLVKKFTTAFKRAMVKYLESEEEAVFRNRIMQCPDEVLDQVVKVLQKKK